MIAHDVVYYQPESAEEAVTAWRQAADEGLEPEFVGGGTEVVTMIRDGRIRPGALVDLKGIQDCGAVTPGRGVVRYGACLSLNEVVEDRRFGLLAAAAGGIADHTVRNTITLAGNVAGRLPYREAALALLLAGAVVETAGGRGIRRARIGDLFHKRLELEPGELVTTFEVPGEALEWPWFCERRTRVSRVDYPLLTLCAVRRGGEVLVAVSGLLSFPALLGAVAPRAAASDAVEHLLDGAGAPVRSDMRGSAEYRRALFVQVLGRALSALEG